jgi:acyl-CoA synthetase (AMP-forming)/AMP-acid ligase II
MITHGCVSANAGQIAAGLGVEQDRAVALSWLPLFHDMGFILAVAMPVAIGATALFTDPVHFLMRPVRWLQLASGRTHVFTAGPNFAYEYCATRIGEDERTGLDLSGVRAFLNGAEPVRPATMRRFYRAFAGCGLSAQALVPAYGLAEATVYVASGDPDQPTRAVWLDRAALQRGDAVVVGQSLLDGGPDDEPAEDDGAVAMISCGAPSGQHVAIVDPAQAAVCPPGRVGEIWINGPNVSPGYFRQRENEVFGAVLAAPPDGLPAGGWLRTGDTGVCHDGELIVTGRLKDLIIIDGRNHYPQDVEETVHAALDADRRERAAVFAVPGDEGESVVAVAERRRDRMKRDVSEAVGAGAGEGHGGATAVHHAVRARVAGTHGLRLDRLVLVPPGTIPRTSSGKVSRSACRAAYLRGEYAEGHR